MNFQRRLYDITTRKQVYLEQVKRGYFDDFIKVLKYLKKTLQGDFNFIRTKQLDDLTKAKLSDFLRIIKKSISGIFGSYVLQLIKDLENLANINRDLSAKIYLAFEFERKYFLDNGELPPDELLQQETNKQFLALISGNSKLENEKLFSYILNTPIPANGLYLKPFLTGFAISQQANILSKVVKGYANKDQTADLQDEIVGDGGAVDGMANLGDAVIATAAQQVASLGDGLVGSQLFSKYRWVSVLDSRTTPVCQSRNGMIFEFGKGPLPPAHIRCRSHIFPIVDESEDFNSESFNAWSKAQPPNVQLDLFGEQGAKNLQKSISADEFGKKLNFILTK